MRLRASTRHGIPSTGRSQTACYRLCIVLALVTLSTSHSLCTSSNWCMIYCPSYVCLSCSQPLIRERRIQKLERVSTTHETSVEKAELVLHLREFHVCLVGDFLTSTPSQATYRQVGFSIRLPRMTLLPHSQSLNP